MKTGNQRGMALMAVLWMLLILSALTGLVVIAGSTETSLSVSAAGRVKAEAMAEAGIYKAIAALAQNSNETRAWRVDGTAQQISFENVPIEIRMNSEAGKIDINASDQILLSALIGASGVSDAKAVGLAAAIVDHRNLKTRDGNPPFATMASLMNVSGMTRDLYTCIRPALTIYSGLGNVDVAVAPPAVMQVVKWAADKRWQGETWLQTTGSVFGPHVVDSDAATLERLVSRGGLAFTIDARVDLGDGAKGFVEAVVRITGNPADPFWVMGWKRTAELGQGDHCVSSVKN